LPEVIQHETQWDCLIDAGEEHALRVVGLKVLEKFNQR